MVLIAFLSLYADTFQIPVRICSNTFCDSTHGKCVENIGCSLDLVADGQEAVSAITEKEYDLVLMDCHMPLLDGYQATTAIRCIEKTAVSASHIPIIAVTANALAGDREKCLVAGMDDYISKPFKQEELLAIIGYWSHKKIIQSGKNNPALVIKEKEDELYPSPIEQSVFDSLKKLQMERKPDILEKIITAYIGSSGPY